MRTIRIIGIFLLVLGLFTATRGAGWQLGYVFLGIVLLGCGVIVLANPRPRRLSLKEKRASVGGRKPIVPRPGRIRRANAPTPA